MRTIASTISSIGITDSTPAGRGMMWSLQHVRGGFVFQPGSVASWIAELDFDAPPRADRATLIRVGEQPIARTHAITVSVERQRCCLKSMSWCGRAR